MYIKISFLLSFGVALSCGTVIRDLTDADYNRMPELFVIDDYNECMRRTDGIYCSIRVELDAEPNNELYNLIQEYSADRLHHFNHSILNREVCVQKTCKEYFNHTAYEKEDLTQILGECFNKTIWNEYGLYAKVINIHYCKSNNERTKFNQFDFVVTVLVIGILMMNLIGSFYHISMKKNASETNHSNYLMTFSIVQNLEDLFKTSKAKSIKGLNGLRVTVLLCTILAHTVFCISSFGDDIQYFEKLHFKTYFQIITYSLSVIQICFAMSGFLLAYKISDFENATKVSWKDIPKILFLRIVRLSPSYAVVMLIFISWVRDLGSGALWTLYVGGPVRDCHRFFWHHMFYINNYVDEDVHCSIPTWYAAADTQLFIVGLFVLCLTKQRRMLALSILMVLSLVGPLVDIWLKGFDAVAIVTPEFSRTVGSNEFRYSHIRGHNNLTSFIGAIITGLLVFRWHKQGVKIESKLLTHLSNLAPLAIVGVFLSVDLLYADGSEPSLVLKLVYAAAYRITLSAIIAFSLISISMNFDSILCRLLSWSGWEVPSKLCYSVFLIHMKIILILIGLRSTTENISFLNLVVTFLGVTVLSFIIAVPLYVLVEVPCGKLMSRTLKTPHMKQENKAD